MKTKAPAIAGIAFLIVFAGLCLTAFFAQRTVLGDHFLAVPSGPGSPRIDVRKIEEFAEKEFLITYEITGAQRLILPHADFPVTVIGTTSSYSQILKPRLINGSFFSKQAWNGKLRHAVLSETAANAVFGSTAINGSRFRMGHGGSAETWLVTGVIRDGDEDHSRVYVPSSIRDEETSTLLALMQPSGGFDAAYIKSRLKTLGIQEGEFLFFDMEAQNRLLWERIAVLLLVFFALLFLSLLGPLAGKFTASLSVLRAAGVHHYMGDIFRKTPALVIKPVLFALGAFVLIAIALVLFLRTASLILPWQEIPSLAALNREIFYPHLLHIRNFELASRFLFYMCSAFLGVFFAAIHVMRRRCSPHP